MNRLQIVSLLCFFTVAVALAGSTMPAAASAMTETSFGSQASVALTDGSMLQINGSSCVKHDLTAYERRVDLSQGEVRVKATKDPRRPFIVNTPHAAIRAVGTVFNVSARHDETSVAVVDGSVEITGYPRHHKRPEDRDLLERMQFWRAAAHQAVLVLNKGQHASIGRDGAITLGAGPTPEEASQWPKHKIEF